MQTLNFYEGRLTRIKFQLQLQNILILLRNYRLGWIVVEASAPCNVYVTAEVIDLREIEDVSGITASYSLNSPFLRWQFRNKNVNFPRTRNNTSRNYKLIPFYFRVYSTPRNFVQHYDNRISKIIITFLKSPRVKTTGSRVYCAQNRKIYFLFVGGDAGYVTT